MLKKAKVSIILPVWNPGPGIERCIQSLQRQTLREIEMIFVDDLGTDGAMDTVRMAAEKDPRIRILSNAENIGPGPSRNRGIEAAEGEYLSFIDPDDYVEEDFLEKLYHTAVRNDSDIIKGTIILKGYDGSTVDKDLNLDQAIKAGLKNGTPLYRLFRWEHQSGLYRREMILRCGAYYGSTRRGEDSTFLLRACCAAESFQVCKAAVYYYCERSESELNHFSGSALKEQNKAVREQLEFLQSRGMNDDFALEYLYNRIFFYLQVLARYAVLPGMQENVQESMLELKQIVETTPYGEELAKRKCVIDGLLTYETNLCTAPYKVYWEKLSTDVILEPPARWVEFILRHPEADNKYRRGLNLAFMEAMGNLGGSKAAKRKLRSLKQKLPVKWQGAVEFGFFDLSVIFFKRTWIKKLVAVLPAKIYNRLYTAYKKENKG